MHHSPMSPYVMTFLGATSITLEMHHVAYVLTAAMKTSAADAQP